MKARIGPDGLHMFDRQSGLNILLDEISYNESQWSLAPRQISIALTNLCDLQCSYCYAPKHRAALDSELLIAWLKEVDKAGCIGVGFGGGEPTLHPEFSEICRRATMETKLAITFTTHGHRLVPQLLEKLTGNIHFMRISMDGVEGTYETLRRRKFSVLLERMRDVRQIVPFGINVVVNEHTIFELDRIAEVAHNVGASELLLLPQQSTSSVDSIDESVRRKLHRWIHNYCGSIRLSITENESIGLPILDSFSKEKGLFAYAHIDASGIIKENSYQTKGAAIGTHGVIVAVDNLRKSKRS